MEINQLRQQLYDFLINAPRTPRNKRLSPELKQGVIEKIGAFKDLKTLSS